MIRQDIINSIKAAMTAIVNTTASTCPYTNTVKTVDVWRRIPHDESELPAINIKDSDCDVEALSSNYNKIHKRALNIEIVGTVSGTWSDEDARTLLSDIYTAISVDPTWGGNAQITKPVSDSLSFEHADDKFGSVIVKIQVLYHSTGWEEI